MIRRTFSYNGTTDILLFKGHQCSEDYQKVLKVQLLSFGKLLGGVGTNGCTSHTIAPLTYQSLHCNGLDKNQVTLMDWPALIPDLNPMENLW